MIANTVIGTNFQGVFNYCLAEKKGAKVLGFSEDIIRKGDGDPLFFAKQFEGHVTDHRHLLRSDFKNIVDHTSLSFGYQDELGEQELLEIAQKFMIEKGYEGCQYVVIQHFDTEHTHVHLVLNRVDESGSVVNIDNNYFKNTAITNRLEQQYNLQSKFDNNQKMGLTFVPQDKNEKTQEAKVFVKSVIDKAVISGEVKNVDTLLECLERHGIDAELKEVKGTVKGISFSYEDKAFKGSEVGWSLPTIEKQLEGVFEQEQLLQQLNEVIAPKCQNFKDYISAIERQYDIKVEVQIQPKTKEAFLITYQFPSGKKIMGHQAGVKVKELSAMFTSDAKITQENLKEVVGAMLKQSTTIEELSQQLADRGVEMEVLKHSISQKTRGLHFHLPDGKVIKGSKIGWSYKKVQSALLPRKTTESESKSWIQQAFEQSRSRTEFINRLSEKDIKLEISRHLKSGIEYGMIYHLPNGTKMKSSISGVSFKMMNEKFIEHVKVADAVSEALKKSTCIDTFKNYLKTNFNIETRILEHKNTKKAYGVRFIKSDGEKIKGSDAGISIHQLKNHFEALVQKKEVVQVALAESKSRDEFTAYLTEAGIKLEKDGNENVFHTEDGVKIPAGATAFEDIDKMLQANMLMQQLQNAIEHNQPELVPKNIVNAMAWSQAKQSYKPGKYAGAFKGQIHKKVQMSKGKLSFGTYQFDVNALERLIGPQLKNRICVMKQQFTKFDSLLFDAFLKSKKGGSIYEELNKLGVQTKVDHQNIATFKHPDFTFKSTHFGLRADSFENLMKHQLTRLHFVQALHKTRNLDDFEKTIGKRGYVMKENILGKRGFMSVFTGPDDAEFNLRDLKISHSTFAIILAKDLSKNEEPIDILVNAVEQAGSLNELNDILFIDNLMVFENYDGLALGSPDNLIPLRDLGFGWRDVQMDFEEFGFYNQAEDNFREERTVSHSQAEHAYNGGGGSNESALVEFMTALLAGGGGASGVPPINVEDEEEWEKRKKRKKAIKPSMPKPSQGMSM
ncbi:relaxase/mobilization nuclease domain-containing protein [Persicobacter psychrovividus]|uniref:MobA/VirD2-like nuclease domain-containing protein n=1 Tax=Persicobacter psychrovividus TaxID=387638 RepID=A0ABN6LGL0_9BACT|nr:hypothetical protein PEPS_45550 [Persicobacter psychrovividus]